MAFRISDRDGFDKGKERMKDECGIMKGFEAVGQGVPVLGTP
jgi:hypothetical protein